MAECLLLCGEDIMAIYVNNQLVKQFNFSAGECQVQLADLNITENTKIKSFLEKL